MSIRTALTAALSAGALALVGGCSSFQGQDAELKQPGEKFEVLTSFYPLQYVTGRIAGDRATVGSLTPPGAEPHDLELTPRDVTAISDADLVVYLDGFQPAIDTAVDNEAKDHRWDVAETAALDRSLTEDGETALDPHFWLDPQRLISVSAGIAQRLEEIDPAGAQVYRAGLKALNTDLEELDEDYRTSLADCTSKDLVTSHEAFGYLAERYGMVQVGIVGLSPDEEPNPATLASVTDFVRKNKVRTIYYETLISSAIATTVAKETGARTAVLDPIEGLTDTSQGRDYLAVMRSNLSNLREGQPCL